jgi:hypothetical protein
MPPIENPNSTPAPDQYVPPGTPRKAVPLTLEVIQKPELTVEQLMAAVEASETQPPLFIPLNTQFYEAFEPSEKTCVLRLYSPRWNEKACPPGRRVIL